MRGSSGLLALQQDFKHWLLTESAEAAARLGEDAAPGLAVYLNNYRGSLMRCLGETYAVVRAWIGDEAFEATAAIHIERVPPSSWTLDAYARSFPETVAARFPADPEVGELALLDRALSEVFVGPDATPVIAGSLGEVDWERAVIRFVPAHAILRLQTSAPALWQAVKAGTVSQLALVQYIEPAPVLVWRQDFVSTFRELDPYEADALERLSGGMTFGALCAALVGRHGEGDGAALAGSWLGQWLGDGLIAAIEAG